MEIFVRLYNVFGRVGRFSRCRANSCRFFLFHSLSFHPTKTEAVRVATGLRTKCDVHLNNEANTHWAILHGSTVYFPEVLVLICWCLGG
jgi:hypothetical protein